MASHFSPRRAGRSATIQLLFVDCLQRTLCHLPCWNPLPAGKAFPARLPRFAIVRRILGRSLLNFLKIYALSVRVLKRERGSRREALARKRRRRSILRNSTRTWRNSLRNSGRITRNCGLRAKRCKSKSPDWPRWRRNWRLLRTIFSRAFTPYTRIWRKPTRRLRHHRRCRSRPMKTSNWSANWRILSGST